MDNEDDVEQLRGNNPDSQEAQVGTGNETNDHITGSTHQDGNRSVENVSENPKGIEHQTSSHQLKKVNPDSVEDSDMKQRKSSHQPQKKRKDRVQAFFRGMLSKITSVDSPSQFDRDMEHHKRLHRLQKQGTDSVEGDNPGSAAGLTQHQVHANFVSTGPVKNPLSISGGSYEQSHFGDSNMQVYSGRVVQHHHYYYGNQDGGRTTEGRGNDSRHPPFNTIAIDDDDYGNDDICRVGQNENQHSRRQDGGAQTQTTGGARAREIIASSNVPVLPFSERGQAGRTNAEGSDDQVVNCIPSVSSARRGDVDCVQVKNLLFYHETKLVLQSLFWIGEEHGGDIKYTKNEFAKLGFLHSPGAALRMNARRGDVIKYQFISPKPDAYYVELIDPELVHVTELLDSEVKPLTFRVMPDPNNVQEKYLNINYYVGIEGYKEQKATPRIENKLANTTDMVELMRIIERFRTSGVPIDIRVGEPLHTHTPADGAGGAAAAMP